MCRPYQTIAALKSVRIFFLDRHFHFSHCFFQRISLPLWTEQDSTFMFVHGQGLVDTVSETSSRVPALDAAWNAPRVKECLDSLGQSTMHFPPQDSATTRMWQTVLIDLNMTHTLVMIGTFVVHRQLSLLGPRHGLVKVVCHCLDDVQAFSYCYAFLREMFRKVCWS